jgi:hypothetical protein
MKSTILAAATLVAIAIAVPATAHPHPEGAEKIERVIVMTGDRDSTKGDVRSFRIHRGEGGVALSDCDGDKTEIEEGAGKEKTRIFFCGKPSLTSEERARKLEEVRSRLAKNDRLSGEHRARVDAALKEAIERARAGK